MTCHSQTALGSYQEWGESRPQTSLNAPEMNCRALKLKEEECGLCRRADSNPDTYGQKCQRGKLCVHENCLYHASGLVQRGKDEEGFYGFLYPDIRQELKRAVQKTCCVCGRKGASIACQGRKCTKNFHFPCGSERGCIYQFFGEFRSFCWKHRPVQRVRRRQQQAETICVVCLESMPGKPSYSAMVCPACKHAWFHRDCIQGHALRAALYHFRCPRCRDMGTFQREMFRMGIKIPDRDAAWEEDGAFSDQYHRHSRCDAGCCLYVGGREQSADDGIPPALRPGETSNQPGCVWNQGQLRCVCQRQEARTHHTHPESQTFPSPEVKTLRCPGPWLCYLQKCPHELSQRERRQQE
ncbi:PHD finger protein 7-like isoform X2 [Mauremys reevesii]|uniref:PHD finger protein 7-like isoform X2 n=1 Tax=Mauremys reevesii TaxID=260615 RepID=UPI00193FAA9B|nr:PHD finger protein 7-like isoform X2 [Mauremys reevesii]